MQAKFVDAFTGNAVETCRLIGASDSFGWNVMSEKKYAHVREALWARVRDERDGKTGLVVPSRLERLALWGEMMRDRNRDDSIRLRASELLAKAHMDFVEKQIIESTSEVRLGAVKGLEERINQVLDRSWLE